MAPQPEDVLDWIFFWHDVRYGIAKLTGGATAAYKEADALLLKSLEAIDKSLISEKANEYIEQSRYIISIQKDL